MTTKRRSKRIKRRTIKRGGGPSRPVMKPLGPKPKPIHAWGDSASKHGGDGSFEEAEVDEGFIYSDHFNEEDDDDELHHPVGGVNHHMLYNDDESGRAHV